MARKTSVVHRQQQAHTWWSGMFSSLSFLLAHALRRLCLVRCRKEWRRFEVDVRSCDRLPVRARDYYPQDVRPRQDSMAPGYVQPEGRRIIEPITDADRADRDRREQAGRMAHGNKTIPGYPGGYPNTLPPGRGADPSPPGTTNLLPSSFLPAIRLWFDERDTRMPQARGTLPQNQRNRSDGEIHGVIARVLAQIGDEMRPANAIQYLRNNGWNPDAAVQNYRREVEEDRRQQEEDDQEGGEDDQDGGEAEEEGHRVSIPGSTRRSGAVTNLTTSIIASPLQ